MSSTPNRDFSRISRSQRSQPEVKHTCHVARPFSDFSAQQKLRFYFNRTLCCTVKSRAVADYNNTSNICVWYVLQAEGELIAPFGPSARLGSPSDSYRRAGNMRAHNACVALRPSRLLSLALSSRLSYHLYDVALLLQCRARLREPYFERIAQ